jgi:hypothetical protein
MIALKSNPFQRAGVLFLVGISLSIGWGIRGNFGHEYGASFAGCLAALTAAILSGREDWRQRIPYFAFFGALGWGFGATISYMQVISYSESGHAVSQWYGYLCLFLIGFLWAGMGSMGSGFVATAPKEKIEQIFKPLLFVFASWLILVTFEDTIAHWLQSGISFDETASRHKNPLYWFDADYLPASFAAIGAAVYDLYERKGVCDRFLLPAFAAAGALSGWLIQLLLRALDWEKGLASALTYLQGDPSYIDPATGQHPFPATNLLNNWPQWFGDYPQHIGWFIGLLLGVVAYFVIYGKFRHGSSLFAWMGMGWLISFLIFPVFGSILFAQYGGLRMTPPRSDDWAGIVGVFTATSIWMWRNNLKQVSIAAVIGGTIGGLGFSGIQWLKHFLDSFGNPQKLLNHGYVAGSPEYLEKVASWAKWQGQNWHSFLEQSYGFVNGIALAVVFGFLFTRVKLHNDQPEAAGQKPSYRWTRAFAALFILLGLTYFNMVKNVDEWGSNLNPAVWKSVVTHADGSTETLPAQWDMPYLGHLPGVDFLHLSPTGWFNLTWVLLIIACIFIVRRHYREPLPIFPQSSLAKGQIIFLILLWIMVVANFERALTGWHPSRLLTEWVIFVNAIVATALVLILPKNNEEVVYSEITDYKRYYKQIWLKSLGTVLITSVLFLTTNRMIYRYPSYDKLNLKQYHTRFGPEASWRSKPNLKNANHK